MVSFLRCQFIPIRPITDIDDLVNESHRQDGLAKLLLRPLQGSDQIGFDVACRVAGLLVHYITGGESLASLMVTYLPSVQRVRRSPPTPPRWRPAAAWYPENR